MTTTRELLALRQELRQAVAELLEPTQRKVLTVGADTPTTHVGPSLLQQLRGAVATGGEVGRGGGRGTPLPISVDAADLVVAIEGQAADLHAQVMGLSHVDPAQHIRDAAALAADWTDAQALAWVIHQVRRWGRSISDLLDPPRRYHLAAPCPACSARMVWRHDAGTGEEVQTPALSLTTEHGCVCQACGETWPPEQLEHLAQVVAADAAEAGPVHRDRLRASTEGNGGGWSTTTLTDTALEA